MPSENTIDAIWLCASAVAFLAACVVFWVLARAIQRQYTLARIPLTDLATTVVRQKVAISVFALSWGAVVSTAAVNTIWGVTPPFEARIAYRVVAFLSIFAVAVAGWLVKRAMDRDARKLAADIRSDAHRTMQAMERIADQGDATALAGHDERSATATERIADVGEGIAGHSAGR